MPNRQLSRTGPVGATDNAPDDDATDLPALVDVSDDENEDKDDDTPTLPELCDDDLEHLPYEERVQLALTAIRASAMSERKACIYYRVSRGNYSLSWPTLRAGSLTFHFVFSARHRPKSRQRCPYPQGSPRPPT